MCGQLISFFYHLYYNFISLIGLNITLPLCLLLSFLHNRIPCKHNVWVAIILYLLIYFFYPLYLNIASLTSPIITLVLLFSTQKWNFIFTLSKTGPAKTGAARSFPPTLYDMSEITLKCTQNTQIVHIYAVVLYFDFKIYQDMCSYISM